MMILLSEILLLSSIMCAAHSQDYLSRHKPSANLIGHESDRSQVSYDTQRQLVKRDLSSAATSLATDDDQIDPTTRPSAEDSGDTEDDPNGDSGSLEYTSTSDEPNGELFADNEDSTTTTQRPPEATTARRNLEQSERRQVTTRQPPKLVMQPLTPEPSSRQTPQPAALASVATDRSHISARSPPTDIPARLSSGQHQVAVAAGTLLTTRPAVVANLSPAQRRQQVTTSTPQSITSTFDVGAERMLIKQQQQQQRVAPNWSGQQQATNFVGRMSFSGANPVSTARPPPESTDPSGEHQLLGTNHLSSGYAPINERRQDLLYPSASAPVSSIRESSISRANSVASLNGYPLEMSDPNLQVPTICYTPLALLMVILATVLITVLVCFCTHLLIKYLGKRRFDLTANSKSLEHQHHGQLKSGLRSAGSWSTSQSVVTSPLHLQQDDAATSSTAALGGHTRRPSSALTRLFASPHQPEHCAFDNPYFSGDNQWRPQKPAGGLLTQVAYVPQQAPAGVGDGSERLNFIKNHISTLHSRQVTSSVNELGKPLAAQVVDLTSDEQRARVIAEPREGDLVAVDITGRDFIGLGFDVCGNAHDGIFVRTVLARGPARESGCIEPGDRIKCLNIEFENVTLEDAYDLLNCAAPYRMRILLEKRALTTDQQHLLDQLRPQVSGASGLRIAARNQQAVTQYQLAAAAVAKAEAELHGHSGPLNLTKTYIKRLTSKFAPQSAPLSISPAPRVHTNARFERHQQPVPYQDYAHSYSCAAPNSYEQQLLSPAIPEQYQSRAYPVPDAQSHVNAGYLTDNECGVSPTRQKSIEYRSKNAAHRLHGPSYNHEHQAGQSRGLAADVPDLSRLSPTAPRKNQRSISLANTMAKSSEMGSVIDGFRLQRVEANIEQSQSQPEIAKLRSDGQSDDFDGGTRRRIEAEASAFLVSSISSPSVHLVATVEQSPVRESQATSNLESNSNQDVGN